MTKHSLVRQLVLTVVALVLVGQPDRNSRAEQIVVKFSATIFQSPFSSGELAVGGTIEGEFAFDSAASPSASGPNFARYPLLAESITAGPSTFTAGFGDITVVHDTGIELPDGSFHGQSDVYEVSGFAVSGPSIQGLIPQSTFLGFVDTDASIYTDNLFPIDLPDLDLFEVKQFALFFWMNSPNVGML